MSSGPSDETRSVCPWRGKETVDQKEQRGECPSSSKKTKKTVEVQKNLSPLIKLSLFVCEGWHLSGVRNATYGLQHLQNLRGHTQRAATAVSAQTLRWSQDDWMGFSLAHLSLPQEVVRNKGGVLLVAGWLCQGHRWERNWILEPPPEVPGAPSPAGEKCLWGKHGGGFVRSA